MSHLLLAAALVAQQPPSQLIVYARDYIAAGEYAKADSALTEALDAAVYLMDSVSALVWRGVLEYQRGNPSLARMNFRHAFKLHVETGVDGLEAFSPGLARLYDSELRAVRVYDARNLDEPARWRVAPVFIYPPSLRSRRIAGHALIRIVVDTLGRVEERSIEILDTPDSAFIPSLKATLMATPFYPGRIKGRPVKTALSYQFNLTPPPPKDPVRLVTLARGQLRRHRADSALASLDEALDSVNGASPAVRVYAQLVQGMAWRAKGRDSVAAATFGIALAGYRDLTARGVDFAPVVRSLADSVGRLTPRRE